MTQFTPSFKTKIMDLTGRFPYKSSLGNGYILIAFHKDSDAILGTPVKNKQAHTLNKHGYTFTTNLHSPPTLLTPGF